MQINLDKLRKRKIYNIEALRKHLNCETYAELENYGYDVDGYFSEVKHKKHFTFRSQKNNNTISTKRTYSHNYDDDYDETVFMNFSDPTRSDYMGT